MLSASLNKTFPFINSLIITDIMKVNVVALYHSYVNGECSKDVGFFLIIFFIKLNNKQQIIPMRGGWWLNEKLLYYETNH